MTIINLFILTFNIYNHIKMIIKLKLIIIVFTNITETLKFLYSFWDNFINKLKIFTHLSDLVLPL